MPWDDYKTCIFLTQEAYLRQAVEEVQRQVGQDSRVQMLDDCGKSGGVREAASSHHLKHPHKDSKTASSAALKTGTGIATSVFVKLQVTSK